MKTFKQFLLEMTRKSRTAPISVNHAIEWLENNAEGYLSKGNFIYRGTNSKTNGILIGETATGEDRDSANGANFYTLWIDNHPSFSDFPKRSRSFICATNVHQAVLYGNPYLVVPKDTAKVGVVGTDDIWNTPLAPYTIYSRKEKQNSDFNLHALNEETDHFLRMIDENPETWSSLVKALKSFNAEIFEDFFEDPPGFMLQMQDAGAENLYELWEKYVTPKLFKITSGDNLAKVGGEVWIQEDCLFIPLFPPTMTNEDQFDLLGFSEQFPKFNKLLEEYWDIGNLVDNGRVNPDTVSDKDTLTYSQRRQRSK